MRRFLLLGLVAFVVAPPRNAAGQDGFFFKPPVITVGVFGGQTVPNAKDDLFDFFTSELTLERGDFAATGFGAELGVRVASRLDAVMGIWNAKSSQPSEFRHWLDNNDQPIEQVTTLKRVPVTLSARFYLLERGRAVGRYAWVPATVVPFVGGGAGVTWYELVQSGDFVDFNTLEVFHDRLQSSGSTPTAHVLVGAQWWPFARAGLTAEGRYTWGSANLKNGFSDFGSIDLQGFQWTAGIAARF